MKVLLNDRAIEIENYDMLPLIGEGSDGIVRRHNNLALKKLKMPYYMTLEKAHFFQKKFNLRRVLTSIGIMVDESDYFGYPMFYQDEEYEDIGSLACDKFIESFHLLVDDAIDFSKEYIIMNDVNDAQFIFNNIGLWLSDTDRYSCSETDKYSCTREKNGDFQDIESTNIERINREIFGLMYYRFMKINSNSAPNDHDIVFLRDAIDNWGLEHRYKFDVQMAEQELNGYCNEPMDSYIQDKMKYLGKKAGQH